jgi:calmodulin
LRCKTVVYVVTGNHILTNCIEKEELRVHFDSFDKDHSGSITLDELKAVMRSLGDSPTDAEVKKIISEVDADNNGTIEFNEFLEVRSKKI